LANNVKALVGSDRIRLRVGDYRVIMTADLVVVELIAIGTRGSIYE
jgi:mRNA interferase RelE/StbE